MTVSVLCERVRPDLQRTSACLNSRASAPSLPLTCEQCSQHSELNWLIDCYCRTGLLLANHPETEASRDASFRRYQGHIKRTSIELMRKDQSETAQQSREGYQNSMQTPQATRAASYQCENLSHHAETCSATLPFTLIFSLS